MNSKELITDRFEKIGLPKGSKINDWTNDNFKTTDGTTISLSRLIQLFPDDFKILGQPTDGYLKTIGIL
jgi:hypothetical protein|nr:MAG TPA: hypothetical protein [Caudoviricetes sp.]